MSARLPWRMIFLWEVVVLSYWTKQCNINIGCFYPFLFRENFARNALQCFDWSIRDLSSPDPPRTLRFIYELIHFSYFAQLRHAELEDIFKEKVKRI